MASTSDKLAKLESKISKRQKHIADEQDKLDKDLEEYNKLALLALADKFKLSGKDLFSAIEREHEQLEKLHESEQSEAEDSTSSVGDTAVKHSSFPRNNMSEGAMNERIHLQGR